MSNPEYESDHSEALQTVGLNHVNRPDFEDTFIDPHLVVVPQLVLHGPFLTVVQEPAAVPRAVSAFANQWNKTPLCSGTGHPLKTYGRKLVGMRAGDCDFNLHCYVTDCEYPFAFRRKTSESRLPGRTWPRWGVHEITMW